MKKILEKSAALRRGEEHNMPETISAIPSSLSFFSNSIFKIRDTIITMACDHKEDFIVILATEKSELTEKFEGEIIGDEDNFAKKCRTSSRNAAALRELFPWTAPVKCPENMTAVCCNNFFGLSAPGFIKGCEEKNLFPVLTELSPQNCTDNSGSFQQMVDKATFQIFECGYRKGFGAAAENLQNLSEIDAAIKSGISMYSIDLAAVVADSLLQAEHAEINAAFARLPHKLQHYINKHYNCRKFSCGDEKIYFSSDCGRICAVAYPEALSFIKMIDSHIKKYRADNFDLEISWRGNAGATEPEHLYYLLAELKLLQVNCGSIAPRLNSAAAAAVKRCCAVAGHFNARLGISDLELKINDDIKKYPLQIGSPALLWLPAMQAVAADAPELFRVTYNFALKNCRSSCEQAPEIAALYDEELHAFIKDNVYGRKLLADSMYRIVESDQLQTLLAAQLHRSRKTYCEYVQAATVALF